MSVSRTALRVATATCAAILFSIAGPVPASMAGSFTVSGAVTDDRGAGATGVAITAIDQGDGSVAAGPVETTASGAYSIAVDAGTYDFRFDPPLASGMMPLSAPLTVSANQVFNVVLRRTTRTWSGVLRGSDDQPIPGASVKATTAFGHSSTAVTNGSGHFTFATAADEYANVTIQHPGGNGWAGFTSSSSVLVDLRQADIVQDVKLRTAKLTVVVKDSSGNPLPNIFVGGSRRGQDSAELIAPPGSTFTEISSVGFTGRTDIAGSLTVAMPSGVRFGQSFGRIAVPDNVTAQLPGGVVLGLPAPLTLTQDTTVTIQQPPAGFTCTWRGTIKGSDGAPLSYTVITLTDAQGNSATASANASGTFSLTAAPGIYTALRLRAGTTGFAQFTVDSAVSIDLSQTDLQEDIQLQTMRLTASAKNAASDPVSGALIRGQIIGEVPGQLLSPSSTSTTLSSVSVGGHTGSNGAITWIAPQGPVFRQTQGVYAIADSIVARYPEGQWIGRPGIVSLDRDQTIVFEQPPVRTWSGVLRNSQGLPMPDTNMVLFHPSGKSTSTFTGANGAFSLTAEADVYDRLALTSGEKPGRAAFGLTNHIPIDLTQGDLRSDAQLKTARLTIVVREPDGDPVAGVAVRALSVGFTGAQLLQPLGSTSTTISQASISNQSTGASGSVTVEFPAGVMFKGGQASKQFPHFDNVVVTMPDGQMIGLSSPLTLSQDTQILFQSQEPDTEPPAITVPGPIVVEAISSTGAPVTYEASAVDNRDGPLPVSCSPTSGSTFALGLTPVVCSAVDSAGNTASASFGVTVVDTTPPQLTVPVSIAGTASSAGTAQINFEVMAADAVDPAPDVGCSRESGSAFEVGVTMVTCTATDAAGNATSDTFTVTVVYSWSGFLPPINNDGSSIFKLGSTVPVKFQMDGAHPSTARLYLAKVSDSVVGTELEAVSTISADVGNLFRYSASNSTFSFNLATSGLSVGSYRLRVDLGDNAVHSVVISIK